MSRTRLVPMAALALALLAPRAEAAYFEIHSLGARAAALGAAGGSLVDDASAAYWNPARLATLERPQLLLDVASPWGVEGLSENGFAAAGRWRDFGLAFAWHRLGIADVYAEDAFSVSAARRVGTGPDWQLHAGATLRAGRIAFQPFQDPDLASTVDFGSETRLTGDLALLLTTRWSVDFTWVGRDLPEPEFSFVAGDAGGRIPSRHELSVAWRWNRESTLSAGWSQGSDGESSFNAGLEVLFYDVFAIRSGFTNLAEIYQSQGSPNDFQYTGGFGVFHKGFRVDAAVSTNRDLGASYRAGLVVPLARPGSAR